MMLYLLKTTLLMGLLLAVYHLLLGRVSLHRFSRYYLVGALALSLVAPLVSIPAQTIPLPTVDSTPIIHLVEQASLSKSVITESQSVLTNDRFDYWILVYGLYLLVAVALLLRFVSGLLSICLVVRKSSKTPIDGATVVLLSEPTTPYSFFGCMFLTKSDYESGAISPEIIRHELTHIRQGHSIDILLVELLQVVLWFNPLVYLYKRAIKQNHEYLADQAVVAYHPNVHQYQHLLLDMIFRKNTPSLVSSINFSLTKKRLVMMTKKTSKAKKVVLGVAALGVLIPLSFCFCSNSNHISTEITQAKPKGKEIHWQFSGDRAVQVKSFVYITGNVKINVAEDSTKQPKLTPFDKLSKQQQNEIADSYLEKSLRSSPAQADLNRWISNPNVEIWVGSKLLASNSELRSYNPSDLILLKQEDLSAKEKAGKKNRKIASVWLIARDDYMPIEKQIRAAESKLRSGDISKLDTLYILNDVYPFTF